MHGYMNVKFDKMVIFCVPLPFPLPHDQLQTAAEELYVWNH